MRRLLFLLAVLCVVLALAPAAALAATSFDKSVDRLLARGYPQRIENYLCSLGTNPDLGFRWAGTSADNAAARYLARKLRAMGLKKVRLERVPVDVFEFTHADVTVGQREMTASTFIGVRPTPKNGITSQIVYVHQGTANDFTAAGDVRGKLVLIDKAMSSWWFNLPAWEAWTRGAKGVIFTFSSEDPNYYSYKPDALGSFDSYYDYAAPPMVYISQTDGDWLKGQIAAGLVTATLTLDEKVKLAADGGFGYNVVAELPGKKKDGQMVVMAAHHDCHFRAGLDDTGAVANLMTIAKAMKSSGYKPQHKIVFLFTTGEEGGIANAYYDWLRGAWHAITKRHKDWVGRVRAMINLEVMCWKGGELSLRGGWEFNPYLQRIAQTYSGLVPYGSSVGSPESCWNDAWTFNAAGVPSMDIANGGEDYHALYHTQYENPSIMDWKGFGKIAKLIFRVQRGVNGGRLPYSLKAQADDLAAKVDEQDLLDAGASAGSVHRLVSDVAAFQEAATEYDANVGRMSAAKTTRLNRKLLAIEKIFNRAMIALSPYDPTLYPHQQVLRDTRGVQAAIAALQQSPADAAAALDALSGVYLTWYGMNFSYPVYRMEMRHHDPGYYNIGFGGQGHLPDPLDVMPEYRMIEAGNYDGAISGLTLKLAPQRTQLNDRISRMASTLERLIPRVEALL